MDYQKNATSQVNKYRVDQVCMLSDGSVVTQKFEAKHTHLKTVKLYFSNDYSGVAKGKLVLNILDLTTGESVAKVSRKNSNLLDFDYTDFDTDVQLEKGREYAIQISTVGTESGREPIVYQWSTRETGFEGKLQVNRVEQQKYLVAQFYYPVTIYQQWAGICALIGLVILLVLYPIPVPEKGKAALGYLLFYASPLFTFWFVERFTNNSVFRLNPGECLLNILVYYLFFGILYLLFVSRKAAVTVARRSFRRTSCRPPRQPAWRATMITPSSRCSCGTPCCFFSIWRCCGAAR